MVVKLVGAMRRCGRFTPRDSKTEVPYDNLVLFVLERLPEFSEPDRQESGEGYNLINVKIRWREIPSLVDIEVHSIEDFFTYFGDAIELEFDSNGRPKYIHFLK